MRSSIQIIIALISFVGIIAVIGGVLLIQLNKINIITEETWKWIRNNPQTVYLDIFIFTIIISSFIFFIIRFITNPIKKLQNMVGKIAGGDLDTKIDPQGTDEIHDLAISVKDIINAFKKNEKLQSAIITKYKDLYERTPCLYCTIDLDGLIADCNKLYTERLGYSNGEVIGTHYNKYIAPEYVQSITNFFKTWKMTKNIKDTEIWLRSKDGTIFPTIINASNINDENGNLIGCTIIIRDISEIYEKAKKREKDIVMELQVAEIKKMEKLKDEFASMMTHELKTPLTPIMGHCEMLIEPTLLGNLNQTQLDSINKIYQNALRLERLIGDVMLAQRLEVGKMNFDKQKFEVTALMSEIHHDYSPTMKEKQINFVNSTQENLNIWSDKNRIRQVIDNLIQNAVDFIPKNNGMIEIGAKTEDDKIVFFVKDNGVGIPNDVQSIMFKKFYQVDASHRRRHTGTGLGLVICKGIVEGLGGTIWFESQPNINTVFYFTIPMEVLWKN